MIRKFFCGCAAAISLFMLPIETTVANAATECGKASWYQMAGKKTASGQVMNPDAMTAAHRTLPFGSKVQIVNNSNGKRVVVRINDRGPFVSGRVIDVSRAAASKLGFINNGHAKVCLKRIG